MLTKPNRPSHDRNAQVDSHFAPNRLAYLIGQLDRILSRRLTEALAAYGLPPPQFAALNRLHASERLTNAQLARDLTVAPQVACEIVKALDAKKWIVRERDMTNRRAVLLHLSEMGRAVYESSQEAVVRIEQRMLGDLTHEGGRTLEDLLQVCVHNLKRN
ncbi:DNA-binding MarR family transcriptional regulator [Paraburkholderia sp. BL27I4N3]|uniref:MarR family winged helix-turn-helix transcriptional regulator n=1 Tax=Paraburkholderia sp. BL27I4N3 TaxID=1938805 RepID=UPI000E253472|nr:MarR family transcriptional regulator [Paraburkholderia sp. BL27I4N3]REE07381.1 DNA-binding MarR family transcriptional regulator [Paraburkholderia sp. BL27I4N3]